MSGDKKTAKTLAKKLEKQFKVSFRAYPVYKDKEKRKKVDPTQIRLYANYGET